VISAFPLSLSSSRRLVIAPASSAGAITVHSVVAPSGELLGKGQVWCALQCNNCVMHTWALQGFVRWGAIQINVLLSLPLPLQLRQLYQCMLARHISWCDSVKSLRISFPRHCNTAWTNEPHNTCAENQKICGLKFRTQHLAAQRKTWTCVH